MKLIRDEDYYRIYCNLYEGNVPEAEMDRMGYVLQQVTPRDPVKEAGGCYCGECQFWYKSYTPKTGVSHGACKHPYGLRGNPTADCFCSNGSHE